MIIVIIINLPITFFINFFVYKMSVVYREKCPSQFPRPQGDIFILAF